MSEWQLVRWSEAGQVTALLGWPDEDDTTLAPSAFVARLLEAGRLEDAVSFLGHALPRREVVAWAAQCLRALEAMDARARSDARPRMQPDQAAAVRAAFTWVNEPGEGTRRAAGLAADHAVPGSPEALLASAAFFSGGSIGPEDFDPIPAPRDAAAKFAVGAVRVAAARVSDQGAALQACIEIATRIATAGLVDEGRS